LTIAEVPLIAFWASIMILDKSVIIATETKA
jgi:hypothetical protein